MSQIFDMVNGVLQNHTQSNYTVEVYVNELSKVWNKEGVCMSKKPEITYEACLNDTLVRNG